MTGNIIEFSKKDLLQRDRQVARILTLLEELENISSTALNLPLPLLVQTRTSIERARYVLNTVAQMPFRTLRAEADEEDVQPEIERAVLDRVYQNWPCAERFCE
jgi:hypothetical protein